MKYVQALLTAAFFSIAPFNAEALQRNIAVQWNYHEIENMVGFRLYQEDALVCSTEDPQATSLTCTIDAEDGETWFTVAAYFADGTESTHSEPLSFIFSSSLKAQFILDPSKGESPLLVDFDASSSGGTILQYDWMFGDGESGAGSTVSHIFTAPGQYTVTLKITDDTGAYDQQSATVSVTDAGAVNSPPRAVVASSKSIGKAPLPVQFDGSGSSDEDGTIISYSWDFGDGGTASSPLIGHTYSFAGTFYSSLTVTDNGGLNDSVSTPILVEPPLVTNIAPTAVINASVKSGKLPLTVNFNGSRSYDEDGAIQSYLWNFGDGSVGTGKSVRHTFIQPGQYSVTLKVTDNLGAVSAPATYVVRTNDTVLETESQTNAATQIIINFLLMKSSGEEEAKKDEQQEQ